MEITERLVSKFFNLEKFSHLDADELKGYWLTEYCTAQNWSRNLVIDLKETDEVSPTNFNDSLLFAFYIPFKFFLKGSSLS